MQIFNKVPPIGIELSNFSAVETNSTSYSWNSSIIFAKYKMERLILLIDWLSAFSRIFSVAKSERTAPYKICCPFVLLHASGQVHPLSIIFLPILYHVGAGQQCCCRFANLVLEEHKSCPWRTQNLLLHRDFSDIILMRWLLCSMSFWIVIEKKNSNSI